MSDTKSLRIGTRGSPLALAQTKLVAAMIGAAPEMGDSEIVAIKTTGDIVLDRPLSEIGGKGLFTKEIDEALLGGRIDLAVHSAKDLPTALPPGIVLACVPQRADPRDALIARSAKSLAKLFKGARVGTSSIRRSAQILALRPDLRILSLRGNVGTRLRKLDEGEFDAIVVAMAGLERLGLSHSATATLSSEEMLPAVGQGCLAITCREGDQPVLARLAKIDHAHSSQAFAAERAFLGELDGSCRTPIAAFAEVHGARLILRGLVVTPDGSRSEKIAIEGEAKDAAMLGSKAGRELRARLGSAFADFMSQSG